MELKLFERTKDAAYFIWETTGSDRALNLWTCAENIAGFFAQSKYFSPADIDLVLRKGKEHFEYIHLVRNISYRLYLHTGNDSENKNWYDAEKLIRRHEWVEATCTMASLYRENRDGQDLPASANGNGIGNGNGNTIVDYYKGIQF
ncbi:hypothetical protein FACS189490_07810 [Clostridia bacterium]|nr:hypothetical protein FACS189490_07810 [Clostridia bacterium]